MKLYDLLEEKISTTLQNFDIANVTDDSRKVGSGTLFVCVKGEKFDGHDFAKEALTLGAVLIITQRDLGLSPQIVVEDTRKIYGELCASWFNHPERRLKLIGVTGTNGKTTMTKLIKEILMKSGHKVGLLGTIQNEIGDEILPAKNTTPPAFEYMELLSEMVKKGCDCAVMEISSFALSQNRIGTSHFRVAVFTNLTQDHLDYHKTMENYYQAKKLLFSACDLGIINTDDAYGKRLYQEVSCDKYSYGTFGEETFSAENIQLSSDKITYDLNYDREKTPVSINMTGAFNVLNSLAAIAACVKIGMPIAKTAAAIADIGGVKGRCEVIPTGRDFTVICDYAHTPDAIENVLSSLKPNTKGDLICLFGCGGNRDKLKRPLMAKAAAKFADKIIVTSDNPRDENPDEIIKDILKGFAKKSPPYETISDRKEAISSAIKSAKSGDVIALLGKGHEDYQVLENEKTIHFDEREIVKEILDKF